MSFAFVKINGLLAVIVATMGIIACSAISCSNNSKWNRELSFFRFPKDQSFTSIHSSMIVPFLSDMTNLVGPNVNSRLTMSVISNLSHLKLCRDCLQRIVQVYCRIAIYWKIHKLNNSFLASKTNKKQSRKSLILKHL